MKKKMFFVVGLAVSAIAASCFIPLADGNYWWSSWNDPYVTVVDFPDRLPAGTNTGTPVDPSGQDPTLPEDPVEEPPPDYSGGSDKNPTQPTYNPPAPAPQYQAPAQSCIEQAFVADKNSSCTGCVKGVSFSSSYVNSYLNAAYYSPYNLRGNDRKRLAILGILTAGYCSPVSRYQSGYQSATILPRLNGRWSDHSLDERTTSWRRNQRGGPLFCSTDALAEVRRRACETVYRKCNLWRYVDSDCRGVVPDRGNDDDDNGGGSNNGGTTGGSTTGEREVGEGTNDSAGHGADPGGNHGEGPSGASQ
jgi:hypothetical protein